MLCRTIFSKNKKEKLLIIGKIADINQELTTIKSLQNKVMLDPLTSILNHKSAKELILQRISDETKEFVLVIFDIDNFKLINDNYGHQFGDQVLQHIGSTLKNCIRTGDIFSRIGGDEFLIFFEGHPKQNETINRIYKSLSETYKNFKISISMGVAETTTCGRIYNDLFNCADKALYEAKRQGKNMIYYYNPSLCNNFSTISNIDTLSEDENGKHLQMNSFNALHNLLVELDKVFDYVRIIEASEAKVYSLDSNGNLKPCEDNCFSFWNREARCENCISARALANKKRVTKFEYIENSIYEITAIYIEYGTIPLVIEVLSKIDDDSFLNIDTKTDFINTIVRKNNEFYVDFKTSLFNKKYFDEQLKELNDVFGVALINFESTESFDIIAMTSLIRKHIRRNDIVVSLDHDTALIVLQNITSNRFSSVITNIKNNITNINYISGCYGLSKISFLVNEAMLNSKKSLESHNKIFIEYI